MWQMTGILNLKGSFLHWLIVDHLLQKPHLVAGMCIKEKVTGWNFQLKTRTIAAVREER